MGLDYTKKTARRRIQFMDVFHVIVSVAVIVLFIITVISFDRNRRLAPFIMAGAAVLNAGDVIYKIRHLPHGKKHLGGVFLSIGLTLFFGFASAFMWFVFNW